MKMQVSTSHRGTTATRISAAVLFYWMMSCCILCTCQSFATPSSSSSTTASPSTQSNKDNDNFNNSIDTKRLVETIRAGRVYVHENFLTVDEMQWLFADMERLQAAGSFARSGLSDTSRGKQQGFGTQDRSVSPVPW